jgi:DNA-binding MurR/RpiR family transcriptional regulator
MFRDRIKANYNALSPSFRRLADFVLNQSLDVALMTATELAQQMDMDAATVVRFAQTIGYSGFREMLKEIQKIVKEELTASYTVTLDTADDADLFRGLLENEKHNLSLVQAQLTEQTNAILPTLTSAKQIWVLGQDSCAHLAALCAAELQEIDLPAVFIVSDPLEIAKHLKEAGPEDVLLAFSLDRMDLQVADAINFARQREVKTFAFSASPVTAAALAAERTVVCPGPTQTQTASFTGLAALIVVLVAAFATRYPERVTAAKDKLQKSYRSLLGLRTLTALEMDVENL